MIEDRAITGKITNRWKKDNTGETMDALEDALTLAIREIFRLHPEIVSEHYSGEDFGNCLIDRLTYRSKEGNHVQIFLVLEESLVLRAVSSMLGMPLKKVDRMVENTVRQLSLHIADQIGEHQHLSSYYELETNHLMTTEQFRQIFYAQYFDYSLLFNTGTGYFAFCIKLE